MKVLQVSETTQDGMHSYIEEIVALPAALYDTRNMRVFQQAPVHSG